MIKTLVNKEISPADRRANPIHTPNQKISSGADSVKDMQRVIVRWMARQLERTGWSAERWAREASLAPTTVTRAMSPHYHSVSSVPTLHALARAADVPSILNFLEGQVIISPKYPILTAMLQEVLPTLGVELQEDTVTALAHALGEAICGMTSEVMSPKPELEHALAEVARDAVRRNLP